MSCVHNILGFLCWMNERYTNSSDSPLEDMIMWFKEGGLPNSQHFGGDLCDHIIRKTTIFTLMMNMIPI